MLFANKRSVKKGTRRRLDSGRFSFHIVLLILLLSISSAAAALSIYMTPEDLARRSDLVVEATVVRTAWSSAGATRSSWRTSSSEKSG